MQKNVVSIAFVGQLLYSLGSAAFTILERMILLYMPFYYLPPAEYQVHDLIPDKTYFGLATVMGTALLFGRVIDGVADPMIASLSDKNRSSIGRRKIFLLISGFPLALSAWLIFQPPDLAQESFFNGLWLGAMLMLFYIFFTAYVNPYLALIPELGHNNSLRINLSTMIAFFGLMGMVLVTVIFPELVARLQDMGVDFRSSYRTVILSFAILAVLLLYMATIGFNESIHCLPGKIRHLKTWQSLRETYNIRPFRIFLAGEVFLQFAMNMVTLGLIYYAVVIFQRDQRFMVVLASLTIGGALLSFPLVNIIAKKVGKKRVIISGVTILAICSFTIFAFSFNITGYFYYISLAMFALAGFPLAVLTILINPTIADLARVDFFKTGLHREAMFFGARAIPLKLTIALAGVVFAYLLARFGKDIANPLGVQLSMLAVLISAIGSYIFFKFYPEEEVIHDLQVEKGYQ